MEHSADGIEGALERLAVALDAGEFSTVLVTGTGCAPRLSVARRHTRAAEEIRADDTAYRWVWGEPIAGTSDPLTAARRAAALRAAPQPAYDW
jgi:hypothetical protein